MRRLLLAALLLLATPAHAVTGGAGAIYPMKRGEFWNRSTPGDAAGILAADAYMNPTGFTWLGPGTEGLTIPAYRPGCMYFAYWYDGFRFQGAPFRFFPDGVERARIDSLGITAANVRVARIGPASSSTAGGAVRVIDGVIFATSFVGVKAAIDDLPATGGKVVVPAGTYLGSAAIVMRSNIEIQGAGNGAAIFRRTGGLAAAIFSDGGTALSNVAIRDIGFDNNNAVVTGADILLTAGPSHFTVQRCRWFNLLNRNMHLSQITKTAGTRSEDIRFIQNVVIGPGFNNTSNSFAVLCATRGVYFEGNDIDGWGAIKVETVPTDTDTMQIVRITNNRFRRVDQSHIFVRPNGATFIEDVVISGNIATVDTMDVQKGLVVVGEQITGTSGGSVKNVVIANNVGQGHQGQFIVIGGGPISTVENVSIVGNVFDGRYPGRAWVNVPSSSRGIRVGIYCHNVSVVGNTIRYTAGSGIGVFGSGSTTNTSHVTVTGNTVEYASQIDLASPTPDRESGIYVSNNTSYVNVTGNSVYNTHNLALAGYTTSGITIDYAGQTDHIIVADNQIVEDRGASAGTKWGIKVGLSGATTDPDEVSVTNNRISGTITGGIIEYGTGTHSIWGNIYGDNAPVFAVYDSMRVNGPQELVGDTFHRGSVTFKRADDQASNTTITANQGTILHLTGATTLDNINTSTAEKGKVLALWLGGAITVRDNSSSGGNIFLEGSKDLVGAQDDMLLLWSNGTNWIQVGNSRNGTLAVQDKSTFATVTGYFTVSDSARFNLGFRAGGDFVSKVQVNTYTPTRSAEANMDANVTMTVAQFVRIGAVVTVSGRFTADPTLTATTTSFEITLPVASNLAAAEDAAGTAFCGNIASMGAEVTGVAANDTAKIVWKASDITSQTWSYSFTYQVK